MSGWVKVAEEWFENPLIEDLGAEAAVVHLSALAYSCRQLSNGRLTARAIRRLYPVPDLDATVAELVTAGLWQVTEEGWILVDWNVNILSADEVARRKEQSRITSERNRRHKSGDHSMCEYCSAKKAAARSGDAVTDGISDSLSDAPPIRTAPIRTEGEERSVRREGDSAYGVGSAGAPPAASAPPPGAPWAAVPRTEMPHVNGVLVRALTQEQAAKGLDEL